MARAFRDICGTIRNNRITHVRSAAEGHISVSNRYWGRSVRSPTILLFRYSVRRYDEHIYDQFSLSRWHLYPGTRLEVSSPTYRRIGNHHLLLNI